MPRAGERNPVDGSKWWPEKYTNKKTRPPREFSKEYLDGKFTQPTMRELYNHIVQVGNQISTLSEKVDEVNDRLASVKNTVCGYELKNGIWRK